MYDFCFTPFYAAILVIGGITGYATKGSLPSLGAGVGSGILLALLTAWSLNTFKNQNGKKATPAVLGSLCIALGLTAMMGKRYAATGGGVPGVIALVSSVMVLYYCYNLACIPSQPHKAKANGGSGTQEGGERAHAKSSVRRRHA